MHYAAKQFHWVALEGRVFLMQAGYKVKHPIQIEYIYIKLLSTCGQRMTCSPQ